MRSFAPRPVPSDASTLQIGPRVRARRAFAGVAAVFLAALVCLLAAPVQALAASPDSGIAESTGHFQWSDEENAYLIYDVGGWEMFATQSRGHNFNNITVKLTADLDFTGKFEDAGRTDYTVGVNDDANFAFHGAFDGQNHTIKGFSNGRETLPVADCGLFAYTLNAQIRNLNIEDCYVGASQRAGVLVGLAEYTLIENVTIVKSTVSVVPPNNVLNLITNAGMSGGILVGEMDCSTIYNCEVKGGRAVCNATIGVGALGGQPLYLGAMAGYATDSVIEYGRVTGITDDQGKITERTSVDMKYDTAVGALTASEVFVGGLVGGIQSTMGTSAEGKPDVDSRIVDCFSTAKLHSYAACYISVGAGTAGYVGGIAGRVGASVGGSTAVYFDRCSFAGEMSSRQVNSILVLPVIVEDNKFLAGIVGRGGDDAVVSECYYNASLNTEAGAGKVVAIQGGTTAGDTQTDGSNFGPRDAQYAERPFWEGRGFDFAGGTNRDDAIGTQKYYPWNTSWEVRPTYTLTDGEHINKWVMDYNNSMPVHGSSIAATLDFPGAGEVKIGSTGLAIEHAETTDDPYAFAVQGFLPTDESVTITYTEADNPASGNAANEGWKLMGWYRQPDVHVTSIPAKHSLFLTTNDYLGEGPIIGDGAEEKQVDDGTDDALTLANNQAEQENEYLNDDLFTAYLKANVLFHDVNGSVIDTKTGEVDANGTGTGAEANWYDYEEQAASAVPAAQPTAEGASFIGWTSRPTADGKGWDGITATDLDTLKAGGVFYEADANGKAAIAVTAPMNLYPVYADYTSNASVIYEGNEQDDIDDVTQREGYGQAVVQKGDDGSLYLAVKPYENSPLIPAGGESEGAVRFLGWYENIAPEGEDALWVRVSAGEPTDAIAADAECFAYNLTEAGVDLTTGHEYEARFEYLVDYWAADEAKDGDWALYHEAWHAYGHEFQGINGPATEERAFLHWAKGDVPSGEGLLGCEEDDAFTGLIYEPTTVVAHHAYDGGTQKQYVTTDFPGIASVSHDGKGQPTLTATLNEGAKFIFWSFERSSHYNERTMQASANNPFEFSGASISLSSYQWWGEAHLQAQVTFHGAGIGDRNYDVYRTYKQGVFLGQAVTNEYCWHYDGQKVISGFTSESAAAPSDESMQRDGYIFLGWIDKADPAMSAAEFDYVFSGDTVAGDVKAVGDASRALPYLLDGSEVCTRPMDLYPVYAKFNVETTTNIAAAGVDSAVYNIPGDPGIANDGIAGGVGTVGLEYNNDGGTLVKGFASPVSIAYDAIGRADIALTADTNVRVFKDGSAEDVYEFVSLTVTENGEERVLSADAEGAYSCTIVAGRTYEFTANYAPVPVQVVYHLGGDGSEGDPATDVFSCEVGDLLPSTTYQPAFEEQGFFVGWAEGSAEGAPIAWSEGVEIVNPGADTVAHAMHLWPVYRAGNVTVDSNIDDTAGTAHRFTEQRGDDLWLVAKEVEGYQFVEWATGYSAESSDSAKTVTSNKEYRLSGDKRFDGTRYTAIYEKVYSVVYHDAEGGVLYTAKVPASSDRTFVTEIADPTKPDDPNAKVSSPIDVGAFSAIAAYFNEKAQAEGAESREQFVTWQWAKSDGTTERWDDDDQDNFSKQKVSENVDGNDEMHLYPVTLSVYAQDSDSNNYTEMLSWILEENDEGQMSIKAGILGDYTQSFMRICASEVGYLPGGKSKKSGVDGTPTSLFLRDGTKCGTKLMERWTAEESRCIFIFTGELTIEKRSADSKAAGRTFSFTVTGTSHPNGPSSGEQQTLSVPITLSDAPDEDGFYTGSVKIAALYGEYTVAEDAGMAWKYTPTWNGDSNPDKDGIQAKVSSQSHKVTLTATNERRDDAGAWLEEDYRVTNVMTQDGFTTEHDKPGKEGCEQ